MFDHERHQTVPSIHHPSIHRSMNEKQGRSCSSNSESSVRARSRSFLLLPLCRGAGPLRWSFAPRDAAATPQRWASRAAAGGPCRAAGESATTRGSAPRAGWPIVRSFGRSVVRSFGRSIWFHVGKERCYLCVPNSGGQVNGLSNQSESTTNSKSYHQSENHVAN